MHFQYLPYLINVKVFQHVTYKMRITALHVYPVKSLKGIALNTAKIEKRGLQNDRRWMIIDQDGLFQSQRTIPILSQIQTEFVDQKLQLRYQASHILLPLTVNETPNTTCKIWSNTCEAISGFDEADKWISNILAKDCRFVYMSNEVKRPVNPKFADDDQLVSFADGYPFLLANKASLQNLNDKLSDKVLMNRFRPNIVFESEQAFIEDEFKDIQIGQSFFTAVKPCSRCNLINVNQEKGTTHKEPLKTLSTFRKKENKVYFGQNLVWNFRKEKSDNDSIISIGDQLKLISSK